MASSEHTFIFAVLLMYGFYFAIYTISGGAIYGLPSANLAIAPPAAYDDPIIDFIWGAMYIMTLIGSFFFTILINPFSSLWWMLPINWAILGTTVYLFIRTLRGGG